MIENNPLGSREDIARQMLVCFSSPHLLADAGNGRRDVRAGTAALAMFLAEIESRFHAGDAEVIAEAPVALARAAAMVREAKDKLLCVEGALARMGLDR